MTAINSTCYFVPPENLEVSVSVAGVSKDWAFFNISQAGTPVHIQLPLWNFHNTFENGLHYEVLHNILFKTLSISQINPL